MREGVKDAPRARPAAALVAILAAVLLLGAAGVGVRDLCVAEGWAEGRSWHRWLLDRLDGHGPDAAVVAVSIVAVLLGLLLLVVAVKPARRTHRLYQGEDAGGQLWLTPAAATALARPTTGPQRPARTATVREHTGAHP